MKTGNYFLILLLLCMCSFVLGWKAAISEDGKALRTQFYQVEIPVSEEPDCTPEVTTYAEEKGTG